MALEPYLAYLAVCLVIVLVPGPTATLIIANSLAHGSRAGLANVAGTQLGLAIIILTVGLGLASLIEAMGWWFDWLRLAGALYLVWLGWTLIRARTGADRSGPPPKPRAGFFAQGCLVALSNPKTLLFFGALFPQFIDPVGDAALQIAILGATAMAFAAVADGSYALVSAKAGRLMSGSRIAMVNRTSGVILIGGGLWLALARSK